MPGLFDEISPAQIGSQLKAARTSVGLTLEDVHGRLGLSPSTLSDIERGKRRVSAVELYRFSVLYNRPIDFFIGSRQSASFSLLFRNADEASISREAIVRFQDLCTNYTFLRDLLKLPAVPPPPDYSKTLLTLGHAEDIAEVERKSLGLDDQPIRDICDLLENKRGVKIFHLAEHRDKFSGAFAYDDQCYGACFLINANQPARRRTFTVAHEYAHYVFHRDQLAHIDYAEAFEGRNPRERFADGFAAAFLMPKGSVNEVLTQLSASRRTVTALLIIQIATYFGVSFEAAGWRLVSLRKLESAKWRDIIAQRVPSTPIARSLGYTQDGGKPDVLPKQYKYLCYKAYAQRLISFERLAELLDRNIFELRDELGRDIAQSE